MSFGGYGLPMDLPRPEAAIRDARSATPEIRWIAAMSLGRTDGVMQKPAVEALAALSADENEDVRAQSIEGLANQIRFDASLPQSLEPERWFEDPSDLVRCAALANAEAFGVDSRARAAAMISDASAAVRATAARVLGEIGEGAHNEELSSLIDDGVGAVREEAALALVRLGDARGMEIVSAMLEAGGEDAVRAAVALARSGLEAAAAPLGKVLSRRFLANDDRALAAAALARRKDAEASAVIARMLASRWKRTRFAAAQAIALIPFPGAAALVASRIPRADAMEASILIQALAAVGAEEPGDALAAMRSISGESKLSEEIEAELREAMRSLIGRDA